MRAVSVSFENYRNLAAASLTFSPGVNVLWGDNAQGKSNILEGIYYFARGKSFRGVPDRLLVRTGCDFASLTLDCRSAADSYDTRLGITIPHQGRKRLTRGGAPLSGLRELVGSFRAVLFCPEHLTLVSGSPAQRRAFLDIAAAQLSPQYVAALTVYTRALAERNALLRQAAEGLAVEADQWAVYAESLSRSGAYIAQVRAAYTKRLEAHVARTFAEMTGERERPALLYCGAADADADPSAELFTPAPDEALRARLRDALTAEIPREIRAGTTLFGVHRDDLAISLNGEAARLYASQGQTRSLALAMKLAEGAIARDAGGEEPVYLLDDVFSELDGERRGYLLSALGERQVIITSCEPKVWIDEVPGVALFRVCAGKVTPQTEIRI